MSAKTTKTESVDNLEIVLNSFGFCMEHENNKSMNGSGQDMIQFTLEALQKQPMLKGFVPAVGGLGMSFVDGIEFGLRLFIMVISAGIGCVTLWVKVKEAKKLNED